MRLINQYAPNKIDVYFHKKQIAVSRGGGTLNDGTKCAIIGFVQIEDAGVQIGDDLTDKDLEMVGMEITMILTRVETIDVLRRALDHAENVLKEQPK